MFEKEEYLKIAKNGHWAKAIAFAKWSVLGENLKLPKRCKKRFYKHIRIVLCRKQLDKTANIRKIRGF